MGRSALIVVMLFAVTLSIGASAASAAEGDAPIAYSVCAQVPWVAPSLDQQRRHLAPNSRWPTGERADPRFNSQFPFFVVVRSGSISYDQTNLSGLWTLSARSGRRIGRGCGQPGGRRRTFQVSLNGWSADAAFLSADGSIVLDAHPSSGLVQVLEFPGYGRRDGISSRQVVLRQSDAPGCAISTIDGAEDTSFSNVQGLGLDCDATMGLFEAYMAVPEIDATVGDFACFSGLRAYAGLQITCQRPDTGQTLRMQYFDPSDDN
jgi:hypothetical protein